MYGRTTVTLIGGPADLVRYSFPDEPPRYIEVLEPANPRVEWATLSHERVWCRQVRYRVIRIDETVWVGVLQP